jgi:hypothetical protein
VALWGMLAPVLVVMVILLRGKIAISIMLLLLNARPGNAQESFSGISLGGAFLFSRPRFCGRRVSGKQYLRVSRPRLKVPSNEVSA